MFKRRRREWFFTYLFRLVSLVSVLALAAILVFVFVQGAAPFISATAPGIRLVTENIEELTVNGEHYRDHSTFIYIPAGTETISLESLSPGEDLALEIAVHGAEKDPEKKLSFTRTGGGEISYPEAYLYTVEYPGALPGMSRKVHLILPEPPYGVFQFLGGLDWRPTYNKVYGILPMIAGSILASFGAIALGVPVAILCGLFLAEFLPAKPAVIVRSGIELLAGIPSVVYGFFGLMVIVPAVKNSFRVPSGNGLFSAVIVLAVMILPTIITIAETSMRAVPLSYREASLALGATKMQTAWKVVLPHAGSGVVAGIILGISRAVGETMAVILVAGNSAQMIRSPLDSIRTLTATIALEMGYSEGRHSEMLFSIGVVLFIFILALNSIILLIRRRAEARQ
ncbi:MAG: phosphate ABC transporter permease subunit PstC [Spirochaetaceae bacterium]|jgi:phosphate transport system permease protein|nr:phosphate ABC transporter permease subunit PstC [Spirochaetaceae bacterium]